METKYEQDGLNSLLRRIRASSLAPQSKDLIENANRAWEANGLKVGTRRRYTQSLWKLFQLAETDLIQPTPESLDRIKIAIQGIETKTPRGKEDLKVSVKVFLQAIGFRELAESIHFTIDRRHFIRRNELLDEADVQQLIASTDVVWRKAFLALLYYTAARIGEIQNLSARDVWQEKGMVMVRLDGKTGERIVPVAEAPAQRVIMDYVKTLEADAPLWRDRTYNTHKDWLRLLFAEAKIKKARNFHFFRHSRLTQLANKLTDAQLKVFSGWTMDSGMPAVYIHTAFNDLVEKFAELHPEEVVDQNELAQLKAKYSELSEDLNNLMKLHETYARQTEELMAAKEEMNSIQKEKEAIYLDWIENSGGANFKLSRPGAGFPNQLVSTLVLPKNERELARLVLFNYAKQQKKGNGKAANFPSKTPVLDLNRSTEQEAYDYGRRNK